MLGYVVKQIYPRSFYGLNDGKTGDIFGAALGDSSLVHLRLRHIKT